MALLVFITLHVAASQNKRVTVFIYSTS